MKINIKVIGQRKCWLNYLHIKSKKEKDNLSTNKEIFIGKCLAQNITSVGSSTREWCSFNNNILPNELKHKYRMKHCFETKLLSKTKHGSLEIRDDWAQVPFFTSNGLHSHHYLNTNIGDEVVIVHGLAYNRKLLNEE